jgi:hypothetical protein
VFRRAEHGPAPNLAARARTPRESANPTVKRDVTGMSNSKVEERFDSLVAEVHDWVESAVALDEGHFPTELVSDFKDLLDELKAFLDDEESADYKRSEVLEIFVTPEMAEVMRRFPRVRRLLESAWGSGLTERIEEEASGFESDDEEDDD